MKSGALILGIIVSALLLAVAAGLYVIAGNQSGQRYRASIDLIRQIQQLSSSWSIETARVRSDPLADFDSLVAFIPHMARLKENLVDASRRIPELPERLANDIQVYLSLIDAKEERIERFKTGYAVVRNSTRYLPLAATNVMRQAQEAKDEPLARSVSILSQNVNFYLATPSDVGKERLVADMEKLREDSVAYPPSLANAIANLLAHADVLLARQAPTDVLFQESTSNETVDLANRLTGNLEFEIARQDARAAVYERGVLAVIGVLALFWILLAVHQRVRSAATISVSPEVPEAVVEDHRPLPAMALQDESGTVPALASSGGKTAAAPVPSPPELSAESAMLYGYFAERIGDNLAASAVRVAGRIDALHRIHEMVRRALQNSDVMVELPGGADLDEEIEASSAIATQMRREVNGIANLAKRLATFSGLPNGDAGRVMVDVNACIGEVVAVIGANRAAEITKRLGDVPEIFASKTEIRLLLAQILDNSLWAVEALDTLDTKEATIKIDTARRNEEVLITIIDNGVGISPDRRNRIFRPFYTSREGAMGLGLTLAGYLVKKYEGGIKVNSLPGQGTVTRINLPTGTLMPRGASRADRFA